MPTPKPEKGDSRPPCIACGASMDGEWHTAKKCKACRENNVEVQMPKAAPIEPPKEEPLVSDVITDTVIPFFLKPGDTISLNLKHRSFLFVGGIRLTPSEWSAQIPENIEPAALKALRHALEAGDIAIGEKYMPKYPRDEKVFQQYCALLERDLGTVKKKIIALISIRGLVNGFTPREIVAAMMQEEMKGLHRKSFIELLQTGLDHLDRDGKTSSPVINYQSEEILSQ